MCSPNIAQNLGLDWGSPGNGNIFQNSWCWWSKLPNSGGDGSLSSLGHTDKDSPKLDRHWWLSVTELLLISVGFENFINPKLESSPPLLSFAATWRRSKSQSDRMKLISFDGQGIASYVTACKSTYTCMPQHPAFCWAIGLRSSVPMFVGLVHWGFSSAGSFYYLPPSHPYPYPFFYLPGLHFGYLWVRAEIPPSLSVNVKCYWLLWLWAHSYTPTPPLLIFWLSTWAFVFCEFSTMRVRAGWRGRCHGEKKPSSSCVPVGLVPGTKQSPFWGHPQDIPRTSLAGISEPPSSASSPSTSWWTSGETCSMATWPSLPTGGIQRTFLSEPSGTAQIPSGQKIVLFHAQGMDADHMVTNVSTTIQSSMGEYIGQQQHYPWP